MDRPGQASEQVWAVVAFEHRVDNQRRNRHRLHRIESNQGDGPTDRTHLGTRPVVEYRVGEPEYLGGELGIIQDHIRQLIDRAVQAFGKFIDLAKCVGQYRQLHFA